MKKDHLGFFSNTDFLVWVDSLFYVEYNGEENIDHKLSYLQFYVLGSIL